MPSLSIALFIVLWYNLQIMRREAIPALALSATLLASCAANNPPEIDPHPTFPISGEVDLSVLPDTLPPKVAEQQDKIVKITTIVNDGNNTGGGEQGSGVQLDEITVLTAGHVVLRTNGTWISECRDTTVYGDTTKPRPTIHELDAAHTGIDARAHKVRGFNDLGASDVDAAIVTIKDELLEKHGPVEIRADRIRPGEPLFIIGFGPDGPDVSLQRSPYQTHLSRLGAPINRNTPRVVGAVAAGPNADVQQDLVSTGLRDYSQLPDHEANARHGDSGGGVFDIEGRLVGIVSQGTARQTEEQAQARVGTNLVNEPAGYEYPMTSVFPVTPRLMEQLQAADEAACEFIPD